MNAFPEPRPALRRTDKGTVQPASARVSTLAVDVQSAAKASAKTKKKDKAVAEETVQIVITVPRLVRKRLRRKAETYGWSAEEAAAHVIRAWAERE